MFMTVATDLIRKYSDTKVNADMSDLWDLDQNNIPSVSFDPFLFKYGYGCGVHTTPSEANPRMVQPYVKHSGRVFKFRPYNIEALSKILS
jgi:hypothetical protein